MAIRLGSREKGVSDAHEAGESKASEGRGGDRSPPERWSAQRKTEMVLRLLRGEDLGEVSREVHVSPPELEEWRRVFLETGQQGLRRRSGDPAERELVRTRAKLGEVRHRSEVLVYPRPMGEDSCHRSLKE